MRPFDQVTIATDRLLLRPLAPADVESLYAIFSDAAVMRYWSSSAWTSIEQAREMIAADLEDLPLGRHLRLGIAKKQGALIGTCSLFNLSEQSRRAELGYALSSTAWGFGYMQETLGSLLSYGFGDLKLHRLEADIDPRNRSSAKSLERLGFVKEGHLRERWIVDGEVSDSALYGLLRKDWLAR